MGAAAADAPSKSNVGRGSSGWRRKRQKHCGRINEGEGGGATAAAEAPSREDVKTAATGNGSSKSSGRGKTAAG